MQSLSKTTAILSKNLLKLRGAKSQKTVWSEAGVSRRTYQNLEAGKEASYGLDTLTRLGKFHRVTFRELLEEQ